MLKKVFALSCAVLMVAVFMVGCWGNDDSSSSSSSTSSSMASSSSMSSSSSYDDSMGIDSDMNIGTDDSMNDNLDSSMADSSSTSSEAANAAASANSWETTLVNGTNPLPENFKPDLTAIDGYPERTFDSRAVSYLNEMLAAADAAGHKTYLVSAYRSISYQQGLFNRKVQSYINQGYTQADAEKEASTWVARPATSEHNLGLAADIVSGDWYTYNSDLTWDFDKTDLYAWLSEHCAEYGFIMRYQKGKEDITGVVYEPWHYRFVGVEAAKEIAESGLSLEEYLGKA